MACKLNEMAMIENEYEIWSTAEAFVEGKMSEAALHQLKERLIADPNYNASFRECVDMLRSLARSAQRQQMKDLLSEIGKTQQIPAKKSIPLHSHYWRTAAIAAGMAILTSWSTFWIMNNNNKKDVSQYNVLRRELENIKRSQNQLIKDINTKNSQPLSVVKYTGTGFAINNKGFFVTNYHVTEGADSIYIQNHEGDYYKARVVAFEPKTDLAILKVEDDDFKFGATDVPYTFSAAKASLGSKVYTLGFPDDEIVYNEGYISAKNGFQNDSMQYRLELPADPGQSGAPVLDAQGNILAIVTAKGQQNEGNTYAENSNALLNLVHSLPKSIALKLPKVNKLKHLSREQQIMKLEYYTCSVKVYKK
jgi:S1-C subfamily serine protease